MTVQMCSEQDPVATPAWMGKAHKALTVHRTLNWRDDLPVKSMPIGCRVSDGQP